MKEMFDKFKEEYKFYYVFCIEAMKDIEALEANKNHSEQDLTDKKESLIRNLATVRTLERVADIFGYTSEDIDEWKNEAWKKYYFWNEA